MCLLINKPASTVFTFDDVEDYYFNNADGVGFMFAEAGQLFIRKALPKTAEEAFEFLKDTEGRDCSIHYRMKTHGDTDLENCHPYELLTVETGHPMWLMHNGILSTGNAADKSKSDTWHFVRDFLRPLLDPTEGGDPALIFKPEFQKILGGMIGGSNKFVVMDFEGNVATINEHAGVQHKGAWLSNTYAWSSPRPAYNKHNSVWGSNHKTGGFKSRFEYDLAEDEEIYEGKSLSWKSLEKDAQDSHSLLTAAEAQEQQDELDDIKSDSQIQIDDVYQQLDFLACDQAYVDLTPDEIAAYLDINGEEAIWDALDVLASEGITEEEFIDHVIDGSRRKTSYSVLTTS